MSFGELAFPGEDRAEQEMLDNWQFSQDFCEIHLHHSLVHLFPRLDLRPGVSRDNLPWVARLLTADMSSSMGLCHRNDAVFTWVEGESRMWRMKYRVTYRVDELDACQVHIVLRILID